MSEPKVTLAQILDAQRNLPSTPELESAVADFLELPDSQQKAVMFRALCQLSGNFQWIMAQLQK